MDRLGPRLEQRDQTTGRIHGLAIVATQHRDGTGQHGVLRRRLELQVGGEFGAHTWRQHNGDLAARQRECPFRPQPRKAHDAVEQQGAAVGHTGQLDRPHFRPFEDERAGEIGDQERRVRDPQLDVVELHDPVDTRRRERARKIGDQERVTRHPGRARDRVQHAQVGHAGEREVRGRLRNQIDPAAQGHRGCGITHLPGEAVHGETLVRQRHPGRALLGDRESGDDEVERGHVQRPAHFGQRQVVCLQIHLQADLARHVVERAVVEEPGEVRRS